LQEGRSAVRLNHTPVRAAIACLALSLVVQFPALAKGSKSTEALSRIAIDNFGQIDDNYFRGAQPEASDYQDLAAVGVKTVIDLTKDGREEEAGQVKRAGMQFYRIPLVTTARPSDAAVTQFLEIVNNPANQPVYVHCQGGRHRTGVMTAVYEMTKNAWTADRAYAEMKKYRFEGFPGHPELKKFVYDYYTGLSRPAAPESVVATAVIAK